MLKPFMEKGRIEAGCDEAGRGCLAGSVYAAAVILPPDFSSPLLNDSKKLNKKTRDLLRREIESNAISWAVGICDRDEIDSINILNASIRAMHKSLELLSSAPEHLLIDGNRFKPYHNVPFTTVVKGDGKYASIAAASILAKTHRDEYMEELADKYPEYGFEKHKGYATPQHIAAIREFGYADCHRKSFHLKQLKQLQLF